MSDDKRDTIIVQAPLGTQTRWLKRSQALGLTLSDWVVAAVDRPPNRLSQQPCHRCASLVLTADGVDAWQCAQCGLAAT